MCQGPRSISFSSFRRQLFSPACVRGGWSGGKGRRKRRRRKRRSDPHCLARASVILLMIEILHELLLLCPSLRNNESIRGHAGLISTVVVGAVEAVNWKRSTWSGTRRSSRQLRLHMEVQQSEACCPQRSSDGAEISWPLFDPGLRSGLQPELLQ